jgi:plasmid maintenance system antidote protein VapI
VNIIDTNVTVAAKALGVTRPALSGLLNEHVALSPEIWHSASRRHSVCRWTC